MLAFMNGVQAIYHYKSLGRAIDFTIGKLNYKRVCCHTLKIVCFCFFLFSFHIVHLDMMTRTPFSEYSGEREKLLTSFCKYQSGCVSFILVLVPFQAAISKSRWAFCWFLFVFKSLLTTPSNVLPLHLKQTFLPIILIFTEGEGDGIKSRLPFKIFSTLLLAGTGKWFYQGTKTNTIIREKMKHDPIDIGHWF